MAPQAPPPAPVAAAGAAVLRRAGGRTEVLVVHGAKYGDWVLPKGKLDPGESARAAAVREVFEETGVCIRLGPPLPVQIYGYREKRDGVSRVKTVDYWVGHVQGSSDVSGYSPNDEILAVRWVDVDKAPALLTHERDASVLHAALALHPHTTTLVVLRHAEARERKSWRGDDRRRSLNATGKHQSVALVPILGAYGVQRLISSSSRRCTDTVEPYAEASGCPVEGLDVLSEEDVSPEGVADVIAECLVEQRPTVLCTHRRVLPAVWPALGVAESSMDKGGLLVVHHRRGRIAALERLSAP